MKGKGDSKNEIQAGMCLFQDRSHIVAFCVFECIVGGPAPTVRVNKDGMLLWKPLPLLCCFAITNAAADDP